MNKMIAVVGPTASGKSDVAVKIAKHIGGEVVSCDSMQIYKYMDIGTAKPNQQDMDGVKHHLIDFLEPGQAYSVSDYVTDACNVSQKLLKEGIVPVFCGGTGLYITSFLSGVEFDGFENDPDVRSRLEAFLRENGSEVLYNRLCEIDPISGASIDKNNVKRVLRAVEVYETTGVTASEWNRRSKEKAIKKDCLVIGLDYLDRDLLYDRIDKRVDVMLEKGLVDEAKNVFDKGILNTKTASQAIAYKEFVPFFNGEMTLEECVEVLKRNSRRYAKRQLTWFKRNPDINWIYRDGKSSEEVCSKAMSMVDKYLLEDV